MIQIQSLQEYKERVRENKSKHPSLRKNASFLPGTLEHPIAEGRVYAQEAAGGLGVLVDQGAYYELYYHADPEEPFPEFEHDKPVFLEEMNRGETLGTCCPLSETGRGKPPGDPWLLEAGYELFSRNFQLVCPVPAAAEAQREAFVNTREKLLEEGITLRLGCPEGRLSQVFDLWNRRLEFGDIPFEDLHFPDYPDRTIACVLDGESHIIGTYLWQIMGRDTSKGNHVVTDPAFGRRGIGSLLLQYSLQELQKAGIRQHITWIHEKNEISLALHHKTGFEENGRTCIQYILK